MSYTPKSKFNPVSLPKVTSLEEAHSVIQKLSDHIAGMSEKINFELLRISRGINSGNTTTIVNTGGGSSGGGGGGSIVVSTERALSQALTAGTTPFVSFTSAISTSYILQWYAVNSSDDFVGVKIKQSDCVATGFTVSDVPENCTIYYTATPIA